MNIQNMSPYEVGKKATRLVAAKITDLGASTEIVKGNKNLVVVKPSKSKGDLLVRVKSRRSGDWQIPTTEGRSPDESVDGSEFWILVDFSAFTENPDYYVMTGDWLRRKIYNDHKMYLRSHGGRRPISPESSHHKETLESVEQWKDRWDLLELK